jgi:hypothetical protein
VRTKKDSIFCVKVLLTTAHFEASQQDLSWVSCTHWQRKYNTKKRYGTQTKKILPF